MQLRDVDLRSVGHSSQKLWPKTFFGIKMPCILHYNAKKITNSSKSLRFWKTQLFSQIIDQKEQKKQPVEVWRSNLVLCAPPYCAGTKPEREQNEFLPLPASILPHCTALEWRHRNFWDLQPAASQVSSSPDFVDYRRLNMNMKIWIFLRFSFIFRICVLPWAF